MQFFMIVNDSRMAEFVMQNGVDRLFVDLEYIGKEQRQKGLDTVKSRQTWEDVARLRAAVPDRHMMVRINPPYEGTKGEVDLALAHGANSVMLPMFTNADQVQRFLGWLDGRAEAVPLAETKAAIDQLPQIAQIDGLRRVHIGLNDLHLDMKKTFMFEPIADGTLEEGCAAMCAYGVKFGIGGVARAHEGIISPAILLGEHVRLGSDATILSRSFHRNATSLQEMQAEMDFAAEVATLRQIYTQFQAATPEEISRNRSVVKDRIADVVRLIHLKKANT